MKNRLPIIAIDGPSGAGKSTVGRMLARELQLLFLDTGAMYRAVALAVIEANLSFSDAEAIVEVARRVDIYLEGDPDSLQVRLDGRDVTQKIRSEQVSHTASVISAIPQVRREMVNRQRQLGQRGGVVLDGRDISTVVFPEADVKLFLTAVPEERARRRFDEDRARMRELTYEQTLSEINTRDQRDSTRIDSPLAIAEDAIVIDSTELSLHQVYERAVAIVRERMESKPES
ncbi:MAG: (d)CMP kinase [Pyrinomonadaceae bacterium]